MIDLDRWNLNYLPDVYGPLYMGGSVEVAMRRTLALWLPSYIAEINRQLETPVLTVPKSYQYEPDERTIDAGEAQCIIAVPGTIGVPERFQQYTRTTFDARVTVFFGGTQSFNESRAIGNAYCAAVIGAIAQHGGLVDINGKPFAEATKWTGYRVGNESRSSTYWRVNSTVTFAVVLHNAISISGGPPFPSVTTPDDLPVVTSESVIVDQEQQ